jgi:hypothetical protein
MPEWLREFLASPEGPTTLGALGGFFVRVASKVGLNHPRQIIVSLVSAFVFAFILAPAIADYFELGPPGVSAISMIFGLTAPDLARGLLRMSDRFANTGKIPEWKDEGDGKSN